MDNEGNFLRGPLSEVCTRSRSSTLPMTRTQDQGDQDDQDSPSSSGFSAFTAPLPSGFSERPHLTTERRSHSIERTQIYINAQANALKKSVSLRSTSRTSVRSPLSSTSNSPERTSRSPSSTRLPDTRPDTSSFSVFPPHGRVVSESSSSAYSGMPDSTSFSSFATVSTTATSVQQEGTSAVAPMMMQRTGSWRGQSPERIGRSRIKLDTSSPSLRASSLDQLAESISEGLREWDASFFFVFKHQLLTPILWLYRYPCPCPTPNLAGTGLDLLPDLSCPIDFD